MAHVIRAVWCLLYRRMHFQQTGKVSTYGAFPMVRYDGGLNPSDGRRYDCVWNKAAALCRERQVDPIRLVRAAFDLALHAGNGYMPVPNRLLSEEAFSACAIYLADDPERLKSTLISSDSELESAVLLRVRYRGLDRAAAIRQALRDGTLNLSPLYRFCRFAAEGEPREAEAFAEEAFQVYLLASTCYDRAWGDFIPGSLRTRLRMFFGLE